jgi:hypothetical protein
MCSLSHGQRNKWIPKSSMVWPHWHYEKCEIVGCGIQRWVWSVVRKWTEDNQNERVLGRDNNQALYARPTQECRCARTTSEGTSTKNEVNSCLCN